MIEMRNRRDDITSGLRSRNSRRPSNVAVVAHDHDLKNACVAGAAINLRPRSGCAPSALAVRRKNVNVDRGEDRRVNRDRGIDNSQRRPARRPRRSGLARRLQTRRALRRGSRRPTSGPRTWNGICRKWKCLLVTIRNHFANYIVASDQTVEAVESPFIKVGIGIIPRSDRVRFAQVSSVPLSLRSTYTVTPASPSFVGVPHGVAVEVFPFGSCLAIPGVRH